MSGAQDPDSAQPGDGPEQVVRQRVRLGILTIAHVARRVEFGYLLTRLELSVGHLSQHLRELEPAGLIAVEKSHEGPPGRTWVTVTTVGDTALSDEMRRLARVATTGGQ